MMYPNRVQTSSFLVMIIALLTGVESTLCYICTSYDTFWCDDPFVYGSPIVPTDCTNNIGSPNWFVEIVYTNVLESEDEIQVVNRSVTSPAFLATLTTAAPANKERSKRVERKVADYPGTSMNPFTLPPEAKGSILEWQEPVNRERDQRIEKEPRPVEEGWRCYKITFKGVRGRNEVFRGCSNDTTQDDFCDRKGKKDESLKFPQKAAERITECLVCDNKNPVDIDSPPCNDTSWQHGTTNLILVILGAVIFNNL